MALVNQLVSPGVSITITDESYFIPSAAPTVPLIFIATADEKLQPDGVTVAEGTTESGVLRAVTSLKQSVELYGIPRFIYSNASTPTQPGDSVNNPFGTIPNYQYTNKGYPHHADARNEYGLVALNMFLSIANLAYVIRANINLNDDIIDLRHLWDSKIAGAAQALSNLVANRINTYNVAHNYLPSNPSYKVTVTAAELAIDINTAMAMVYNSWSFGEHGPVNTHSVNDYFENNVTATPLNVYSNGYDFASTGTYIGLDGMIADWVANSLGSTVGHETEFTAIEAASLLVVAADDFKFTQEFLVATQLGSTDALRRAAIVEALNSLIQQNEEIASEGVEYNLILCPGYHETTISSSVVALQNKIKGEAFAILDTPMDHNHQELVAGATSWAASVGTRPLATTGGNGVAFYYPHILMINLDGREIMVPASCVALRTYAYSDKQAAVWVAPAGTRRGIVPSITNVGHVARNSAGAPNEFIALNLNNGQRDLMYAYGPSGGINPIVFFPGYGFVVWGQKTSTGNVASAMDRVNVSRLVKYIARSLRKNALSFVFEPNDKITRDSLKSMIDGFLGDLVARRALYDFATICDESNNTPFRVDNNELWCDIAIKPVKAAEFINIPIRIVSTGAEI